MLTQRVEQFLPQSGLVVRGLQDHNFFEYGADRFPQVTQSVQNRGNAVRPPRCSTIGDLRQRAEAIGEGFDSRCDAATNASNARAYACQQSCAAGFHEA